ncbi:hypothetical protein [Streptomyces sp. NPDC048172]|uniref:DUF7144 family membrane protein n=1 Tax=Streptomyces sp. NPDC048172 TaxID=3365505 RepID=UPI0037165A1F
MNAPTGTPADPQATTGRPPSSGWLTFAGIIILMIGCSNVISGLAALFKDDYYTVSEGRLLVFDFTAWGWIWLVLGILQIAVGVGAVRGSAWARATGTALAVVVAVCQLAFLAAFPLWSLVVIGLCVLVIHALVSPPRGATGA